MNALIDTYLALRQAAGFEMFKANYLLHSFAKFATARGESVVRADTAIAWASLAKKVAQRDARLAQIARFARHARLEDPRHELLPPHYFCHYRSRRTPYIYTQAEFDQLLQMASQNQWHVISGRSFATLLGLLRTTGLRISEALALRFSDLLAEGLLIRKTKFNKTRLVPVHETVTEGLNRYIAYRRLLPGDDDHLFVTDEGKSLTYRIVYFRFKRLAKKWAREQPPSDRQLRLHDFRHNAQFRNMPSIGAVTV
jgi:integrase/recombinase XerD